MRKYAPIAALAGAVLVSAHPGHAQDAAAGQSVFKGNCAACHAPVAGRNLAGPSLFGVVGRKAGSVEGFHYSAANKASGMVWDSATLDPYLEAPRKIIPGTTMGFAGVKDARKRADLIAYLATLR